MSARAATPVNVGAVRMPAPLTHAFVVPPGSRLVFVSGLTARDGEGRTVAPGDPGGQADHILGAIDEILRASGGSIADTIKLTVYLADRSSAPAVGKARARWFTTAPLPASTMVQAALMSDDQLVEIEAVAALPAD
ncbi:RidA family protein [Amycolatopsis alkalitolerans]|uniref:RidA family protein n=1 Tax=Amycolatopsis alkalitolerans TaxID=2547244 RepID=A0A5C4M252_9PSEU|nr:RidA family protein [Amycolatopsis alkalitolerans]TNC25732.1 RidA family protein [Amycolatopsis alkalitolerans]